MIELIREFNELCAGFHESARRFAHYVERGEVAHARAIHEEMRISIDRQKALQEELVALLGRLTDTKD